MKIFGTALLALAIAAGPARAQTPAAPPMVPPTAANATAQVEGPSVDLKIDESVARALERNLDIAVERLNPRTFDFSISALESVYRPNLTSTFGQRSSITLPTSQLAGADIVDTDTTTYDAGMAQNFKWGGSSLAVTFRNSKIDSSNVFETRNPKFQSSIAGVFVQPLLRGFRTDSTRTALRVTQINQEISELTLQTTINNTLANVRNAYWDLVYAVQAVEVARRSLELADKLVTDNRARVEIGTLAPIDVVQAEAEAATRRQTLAQSEATWLNAELALKRMIVSGTDDPIWTARINPVDRPSFAPETVDRQGAVQTALANRIDVAQAKKQLESNDVSLRNLVNLTLPALDLTASYGLAGLGGTQFQRQGLGSAQILNTVPGGYVDALRNIYGFEAPSWNLQLNLSYPIGTTAAQANVARAKLQLQQTQAQLKALELQVATDVTGVALQLQSNLKRVEAATAAREFAQKRLEAENSKFEVGMSTNYFVVQAQRDLADAAITELRALLDYRKSQVDFERVQRTALSRAGISVISGGSGGTGSGATTTATGGARQGGS